MSGLRKLERNVVKTRCYKNGNTGKFGEEWGNYRIAKYGESNVPVNTMPKKKRFLGGKDNFIGALKYQKAVIQNYLDQKKVEKETVEATES